MNARLDPSPLAPVLPQRRPAPVRPPLEVVPGGYRSERSRRRRGRLLATAGVLTALAIVFGLVMVHVQLTTGEMRLSSLQDQLQQAQTTNLKLSLEAARLESPARIVADAQALGMVSPPSITYLTASTPTATTIPGP